MTDAFPGIMALIPSLDDIFLTTELFISLPTYIMNSCFTLPPTLLLRTSARYVPDFVLIFLINVVVYN